MSGWLCRSVSNPNNINCTTHYEVNHCPNNTSPQGQIFYAQIGSSNSPAHYAVYAADNCDGPEGSYSTGSNVPGYLPSVFGGTVSGFNAISYDMAGTSPPNTTFTIPAQCTHGSH
jgi:hypothetical protein